MKEKPKLGPPPLKMLGLVEDVDGKPAITGLTLMDLPEKLQQWVVENCKPAVDRDVYWLPE